MRVFLVTHAEGDSIVQADVGLTLHVLGRQVRGTDVPACSRFRPAIVAVAARALLSEQARCIFGRRADWRSEKHG